MLLSSQGIEKALTLFSLRVSSWARYTWFETTRMAHEREKTKIKKSRNVCLHRVFELLPWLNLFSNGIHMVSNWTQAYISRNSCMHRSDKTCEHYYFAKTGEGDRPSQKKKLKREFLLCIGHIFGNIPDYLKWKNLSAYYW